MLLHLQVRKKEGTGMDCVQLHCLDSWIYFGFLCCRKWVIIRFIWFEQLIYFACSLQCPQSSGCWVQEQENCAQTAASVLQSCRQNLFYLHLKNRLCSVLPATWLGLLSDFKKCLLFFSRLYFFSTLYSHRQGFFPQTSPTELGAPAVNKLVDWFCFIYCDLIRKTPT